MFAYISCAVVLWLQALVQLQSRFDDCPASSKISEEMLQWYLRDRSAGSIILRPFPFLFHPHPVLHHIRWAAFPVLSCVLGTV